MPRARKASKSAAKKGKKAAPAKEAVAKVHILVCLGVGGASLGWLALLLACACACWLLPWDCCCCCAARCLCGPSAASMGCSVATSPPPSALPGQLQRLSSGGPHPPTHTHPTPRRALPPPLPQIAWVGASSGSSEGRTLYSSANVGSLQLRLGDVVVFKAPVDEDSDEEEAAAAEAAAEQGAGACRSRRCCLRRCIVGVAWMGMGGGVGGCSNEEGAEARQGAGAAAAHHARLAPNGVLNKQAVHSWAPQERVHSPYLADAWPLPTLICCLPPPLL